MAADTPDRSATTRAVIPVGRPSSQAFARTRHAVITFATLAIGTDCWCGLTAGWPSRRRCRQRSVRLVLRCDRDLSPSYDIGEDNCLASDELSCGGAGE